MNFQLFKYFYIICCTIAYPYMHRVFDCTERTARRSDMIFMEILCLIDILRPKWDILLNFHLQRVS